jgi:hypothetical protein
MRKQKEIVTNDDPNTATPVTDRVEMLGAYNPAAAPPNPFDNLDALRYQPDRDRFATERLLITVPVRKPPAGSFFRVHPSPDYCDQYELVEDEGDFYLPSEMKSRGFLQRMLKPKKLFTYIDVFGEPISMPTNGRVNLWNHSAMKCADIAKTNWVSIQSDRNKGAYQPVFPEDKLPDPVWPDKTFRELLELAFSPYLISDPDHPIVK